MRAGFFKKRQGVGAVTMSSSVGRACQAEESNSENPDKKSCMTSRKRKKATMAEVGSLDLRDKKENLF